MSKPSSNHRQTNTRAVSTNKSDVAVFSNQLKDILDYAGTVPPILGVDVVSSREFMEKNYRRV